MRNPLFSCRSSGGILALIAALLAAAPALGASTAFTYQGRLVNSGVPANGL